MPKFCFAAALCWADFATGALYAFALTRHAHAATALPPQAISIHMGDAAPPVVEQKSSSFSRECAICLDVPKTVRLRPCGHACCCVPCMIGLYQGPFPVRCPLCRKNVELIEYPPPPKSGPDAPPLKRLRTAPFEGLAPGATSGDAETFLQAMSTADQRTRSLAQNPLLSSLLGLASSMRCGRFSTGVKKVLM